jgi:carbon monoxide dehydrogenase subunit G
MAELTVTVQRSLEVKWARADAFALVADVPRSAAHFPGLRGLDDLGGGVFRWRLESFRIGKFGFDVGYTALYTPDVEAGTVLWKTQPGGGNTRADGAWTVTASGDGARLTFDNTITITAKMPRLMVGAANRALKEVSRRKVDTYLRRISKTMNGRLLE